MAMWIARITCLLLTFGLVGTASAQLSGAEQVVEFRSETVVTRDNVLTVSENIRYDFGAAERHGIFRYVPKGSREGSNRFYWTFTLTGVTDGAGKKLQVAREDNSANAIMRIGDPDKTITGVHDYRITYEMTPLARQIGTEDILRLNITGNDWRVPVRRASGRVTVEGVTAPARPDCYAGPTGSTARDCTVTPFASNAFEFVSTKPLNPGSGLTAELAYPSGSFATYLVANQRPPVNWAHYAGYVAGAALMLGSLLWLILTWIAYRIRRSRETIVPGYESPDKLTPAEIGLLTDNKSGMREITATLIDLAVRGYLRIEQLKPKGVFTKGKYKLLKKKTGSNLSGPDGTLFNAVFADGNEVELSALDQNKMAIAVTSFRDQLQKSLEHKGYYYEPAYTRPKLLFFLLCVALLVGAFLAPLLAGANPNHLIWNPAAVFAGEILFAIVFFRKQVSKLGLREWGMVEGFKWYLSMAEKERLKFTDAPKKNPKLFSKLLPYATALGVEKDWAKQFESIRMSARDTGWYSGTNSYPVYIASDIGSGFSSNVSSNFQTSSSGGSGGGFSGGGGGGGGGGSW